MSPTLAQSVGVDIAKDTLEVAILPAGESFRLANDSEGHRALVRRLARLDIARIVFEATGAYHRLIQQALAKAGLPFVKVNPRRARRFAEAAGKLAETDRCDALMLARMGAALELEPCLPASETAQAMKELISARDALIKDRVAALNRQAVALDPLVKLQISQRLRQSTARSRRSTSASKSCAPPTRTSPCAAISSPAFQASPTPVQTP